MNPTKLVSHFSDFSVIFYAIYKNQEITFTIGVHLLHGGPWKEFGCCKVAPGRGSRRGWANSGELAAGLGRRRAGEGPTGALGVDLDRIWGARLYRRASSTAAAGGRHCAPGSGETSTWPRQGAVGLAPGKAREGNGWFARHRRRVERRALLMATGVGHGERGAHSHEGTAGTIFMGGGPACAASPYARRCLGVRGTLVGAPGGEAGDGPPVGARTTSTGRSKGGGAHGLQGHLGRRVA
jgi:hypothetical protein